MSMRLAKLKAAQTKKLTRAQTLALEPKKDYSDGRTKQSFKDETDINRLLARANRSGTISHLQKYEGRYADFADFDFFENAIKLAKGREIFDELPAEIRNEFGQSQAAFFNYVNDPENKDRLGELLPPLAEPGKQMLDLRPEASTADAQAAAAALNQPDTPRESPEIEAPTEPQEP